MLTGALHQRRTYTATPPDTQHSGPHDDDVTKSESSSRASDGSTEESQDGAPSTLMADEPQEGLRDPPSVAEVDVDPDPDPDPDPDGEDASKTLVLISPGDRRKSQTSKDKEMVTEADHQVFGITPPTEHAQTAVEGGNSEAEASPCATPPHTPKLRVPSSIGPHPPIAPASVTSPTFTKVEQTFVHIAETTHMNVMSSRPAQSRELISQEQSHSGRGHEADCSAEGDEAAEEPPTPLPPPSGILTDQNVVPEEPPPLILAHLEALGSLEMADLRSFKEDAPQGQQVHQVASKCRSKSTSRIPVLVSQSSPEDWDVCREVLAERGKESNLSLQSVLKRKEQWSKQACRATSTSVSLSQSTTMGSEETSNPTEGKEERPLRSRIPQPVITIQNPGLPKVATGTVPVTSAKPGFSKKATTACSQ